MLTMLVTTKAKANRFCSVLKMSKMFSYKRAGALLRPGYLYSFSPMASLPAGRQFTRHLYASRRLSYRTIDELVDECAAEVLDGLRLLQRKAKLAEEAANLMVSNAFDAVGGVFSLWSSAHISQSMPFISHPLAPLFWTLRCCLLGAACYLMYRDLLASAAPECWA